LRVARSSTTFKKGTSKPRNSGRKRGQRNKATADIKALAQCYGAEAIGVLVELMRNAEYEPTQVAAAKELLDRGYGKAVQAVQAEVQAGISYELQLFFERAEREPLVDPDGTRH
jgi:hypothetical protein